MYTRIDLHHFCNLLASRETEIQMTKDFKYYKRNKERIDKEWKLYRKTIHKTWYDFFCHMAEQCSPKTSSRMQVMNSILNKVK